MIRKRSGGNSAARQREPEIIENCQRVVRLELRSLQRFFLRVTRQLRLPRNCLAIRLISDSEMARLNRAYRGKKGSTDVLSFPTERRRKPLRLARARLRNSYLGDIAISPATARRNARAFGRPLPQELQILILHGVLHLLGYDHETDRGEMERRETRLRRRLGLA